MKTYAITGGRSISLLAAFCTVIFFGNRASSEDLAADVFLQALRGIRRYQYRGVPLHAWLYRIASNLIADHLNRSAERRTVPLGEENTHPSLQTPDTAEHTAAWHDVRSAMKQLTDDQQQVILLRFFQDLTHEEAAAAMGRRPGAIRALQSRALIALRQVMAQK